MLPWIDVNTHESQTVSIDTLRPESHFNLRQRARHGPALREFAARATRFASRHGHDNLRARSDPKPEERKALEALGYVE